ncbi:MAG: bifunctional riboflavin kinase/FAD synthetase [Rhodospirillales bacterium]|nr:bifunctional riboflavin kinase/FAD synthetase [Alphaproteobacteria bacterium]MBL6928440.1 bifunctional riboflavin kinase/FAD synthetase [Rhodospirillales bacterium]
MRIFRHFADLPDDARGAAIAVGNFDGVHRGHLGVIGEAGRIAKTAGAPWAVMTFEPHPRGVFIPDTPPFRLTPLRAKAREIAALGVDYLFVPRFDLAFSRMAAEDFIHDIIVEGLQAQHVVCGYDFVFGHGRQGDSEMLLRSGRADGFGFTCVQQVQDGQREGFSATRARQCLRHNDPRGATHVLGRPFEIEGRVLVGDRRGRTIGYPTANLSLAEYLRPVNGVYAVRVGLDDDSDTTWHDGVANIGLRPTFAKEDVVLEAHLFDFGGDLYGKRVRVALIDFLRPEQKFDGIADLKAQIAEDSENARRILARA